MENQNFEILKFSDTYKEKVFDVWEESVLATHQFLNPVDFNSIKGLVKSMDFNDLEVYVLVLNAEVAGFIGVTEQKVEMLFVSPIYIGKGLGKKLMDFAIGDLKADKVDVNEQNLNAVKFYQKLGFKVYERTDRDDQGRDYPLLRMKLKRA